MTNRSASRRLSGDGSRTRVVNKVGAICGDFVSLRAEKTATRVHLQNNGFAVLMSREKFHLPKVVRDNMLSSVPRRIVRFDKKIMQNYRAKKLWAYADGRSMSE